MILTLIMWATSDTVAWLAVGGWIVFVACALLIIGAFFGMDR